MRQRAEGVVKGQNRGQKAKKLARQQKTRGADDDEVRSSDKASWGFTGQLYSRQANIKDPLMIAFSALEHDNRFFLFFFTNNYSWRNKSSETTLS